MKAKPIQFRITESGCFEVFYPKPSNRGYIPYRRKHEECTGLHRIIWKECFGEIPSGMLICHHCDNRACINPEHLFLGTTEDNIKDKCSKNRQCSDSNHWNYKTGWRAKRKTLEREQLRRKHQKEYMRKYRRKKYSTIH